MELDPGTGDIERGFHHAIAHHAARYLTDLASGDLAVTGHPDSAHGSLRSTRGQGSPLGTFQVSEGPPPLASALKPDLKIPLGFSALVLFFFIAGPFEIDVEVNAAYIGRALLFTAVAFVLGVAIVIGLQVADWRKRT